MQCSQVGRAGCGGVGGACVPLAQALVCCLNLTWVAAERLERQRRVCARECVRVCDGDRVAAGQIRKCL